MSVAMGGTIKRWTAKRKTASFIEIIRTPRRYPH